MGTISLRVAERTEDDGILSKWSRLCSLWAGKVTKEASWVLMTHHPSLPLALLVSSKCQFDTT